MTIVWNPSFDPVSICIVYPTYLASALQCARDSAWPAVLRSHRHVVAGLRHCRTVSRLAALPGLLRIRSDTIHLTDAEPAIRVYSQCGDQNEEILQPRSLRNALSVLETQGTGACRFVV